MKQVQFLGKSYVQMLSHQIDGKLEGTVEIHHLKYGPGDPHVCEDAKIG